MMFFPFQTGNHLVNQIINIQQLQLHRRVVYRIRQVIGKGVAKSGHRAVVVRATPLSEQIRESVNEHLGACLLAILKEQVLPSLLAATILAVSETTRQTCLLRAGKHHRTTVAVLLQGVQQRTGKAEVALHKLLLVLWAIHSGEIEHEIRLRTEFVQKIRIGINIIFVDFLDVQLGETTVFTVFYAF